MFKYLETIYNIKDKPITEYPEKLISYLVQKYQIKKTDRLLDIGCGRGDFLNSFSKICLNVCGVDVSDFAKNFFPNLSIEKVDLENSPIPFPDESFDIVFSKSFIEHLHYPEKVLNEIYRILKPGGRVISMCPAWEYNIKNYYEDFTHRTPFTLISISDFHATNGFKNVKSEYFIQLPYVWDSSFKKNLIFIVRLFLPDFLKKNFKFVRFSREIMLLSSGVK